jgi:hypothetical protein
MSKTQEQVFVAVRKCPNPTAALKKGEDTGDFSLCQFLFASYVSSFSGVLF